jgi:hypothetical protein
VAEDAVMKPSREDPLVRHARREARVVAVVAIVAAGYSVGYCMLFGYGRAGAPVDFVLGFPAWVFWGIVVPWCLCTLIAAWFSWWFVSDDDLGPEREEPGDA